MTREGRIAVLKGGARVAAAIVVMLALLALFGWAFDSRVLTSLATGLNEMAVSTAICFIVSGGVVFLLARDELGPVAQKVVLGLVVFLLLITVYAFAR